MTIDVEDYFQVSAFAPYIQRDSWPERECRVERNVEQILAMLAARHPRDLLHAGLDCGALPAAGARHRRGRPRAGQPRLWPRARQRPQPHAFRADIARAKKLLEDLGGARCRATARPASPSASQSVGLRRAARGGLPLLVQRLPDRARPLRHARLAALRLRGARGPAGGAGHHAAPGAAQPAQQRWRLLSGCCRTRCRAG
jgi:hypothetical protein